jgi:hypothetical protein
MGSSHLAVYLCSHVFAATRPILLVVRDGGDWQFLCGSGHPGETPRVVGLQHVLDSDRTLLELHNLPDDWEAERESIRQPWVRRPCET